MPRFCLQQYKLELAVGEVSPAHFFPSASTATAGVGASHCARAYKKRCGAICVGARPPARSLGSLGPCSCRRRSALLARRASPSEILVTRFYCPTQPALQKRSITRHSHNKFILPSSRSATTGRNHVWNLCVSLVCFNGIRAAPRAPP